MAGKFEIHTELAEMAIAPPSRYRVLRSDRCISCGECISKCIYDVHHREELDPRRMDEPRSTLCRGCEVCPQQCPRQALEVIKEPELENIGTPPFDASAVLTIWEEATDGKIPVRGVGYDGPFRGEGFDAIWTDMSEIVRPTRDGIHGREHISTEIDLGRKLPHIADLRRDEQGRLLDRIPLTREIPLPVLFGSNAGGPCSLRLVAAKVRAAMELETFVIVDWTDFDRLSLPQDPDGADQQAARYLRENRNHIALRVGDDAFRDDGNLAEMSDQGPILSSSKLGHSASVLVVVDSPKTLDRVARLRSSNPDTILMVEVPASPSSGDRLVELTAAGIDGFVLACGWSGTWADGSGSPSTVTEAVRSAHLALVAAGQRGEVSIVVAGGIARAEHVPKIILLGADAVVVDVALLAALGCRVCGDDCQTDRLCSSGMTDLDPHWAVRRMVNLMAAWRNQLLEVLGAMGLRDVRRLRGEVGRGLFADQLEAEFLDAIEPLTDDDNPVEHPSLALPEEDRTGTPPELMRYRFGHFRLLRSDACVHCGICTTVCPTGALTWPGGLREPPPPVDSLCTGPECNACVEQCPEKAISLTTDHRLDVLGNQRWPQRLVVEAWNRAEGRAPVVNGPATSTGDSGGGFDVLVVVPDGEPLDPAEIDLSLSLNRRADGPHIRLPMPIYGGGMSYGSISLRVMQGRARAAQRLGLFTCTGEGGYPPELIPYADHVITQIATGYFGVREETIQRSRIVEFKYAQGAKPGLGGHLLGDKNTPMVADLREAVPGTALFSPFPFHSVYSIEDHRKHVDWVRQINPDVLVSVKVSTPGDVDMVAVGSYHAGANIVHLDGSYGGTGAAPEVAKKNIAMPIELALAKTHQFLVSEGIRDEIVLIASGGLRTPMDIVKAIALGADGVVVGTVELLAASCVLCRNCEKDRGCPRGIATTDPDLESWLQADWVADRITNLYRTWELELRHILARLGLRSVATLRGRSDLLRRIPEKIS